MNRTEAVKWSKVLKPVKNGQMTYRNATQVPNVPVGIGDIETIVTEEIVEFAQILRNTRKRSTKTKTKRLHLKMSEVWSVLTRS